MPMPMPAPRPSTAAWTEFLVRRNDERVPRAQVPALFDALASAEKTLHANAGRHGEIPAYEQDSALRFLIRRLA